MTLEIRGSQALQNHLLTPSLALSSQNAPEFPFEITKYRENPNNEVLYNRRQLQEIRKALKDRGMLQQSPKTRLVGISTESGPSHSCLLKQSPSYLFTLSQSHFKKNTAVALPAYSIGMVKIRIRRWMNLKRWEQTLPERKVWINSHNQDIFNNDSQSSLRAWNSTLLEMLTSLFHRNNP